MDNLSRGTLSRYNLSKKQSQGKHRLLLRAKLPSIVRCSFVSHSLNHEQSLFAPMDSLSLKINWWQFLSTCINGPQFFPYSIFRVARVYKVNFEVITQKCAFLRSSTQRGEDQVLAKIRKSGLYTSNEGRS